MASASAAACGRDDFHRGIDIPVPCGTPVYAVADGYGLVQNAPSAIEPGKRPLSSITTTIVAHNGNLRMRLGAPGSQQIRSRVLQVLLNVLDFGMNIKVAEDRPRIIYVIAPRQSDTSGMRLMSGYKRVFGNMRNLAKSRWWTILLAVAVPVWAGSPTQLRQAMVVADEPLAAEAGAEVLRSGGNAVDAAVTVAFVLGVTHPAAGNLGGGGFLLARLNNGQVAFLDFRECAPSKAHPKMYLDAAGNATSDSLVGWRASGVPGTVKGLEHAHRKWGRKPWKELLAPAIRLASEGFAVSFALADSLRASTVLPLDAESRRIFLKGGAYFEAGETLKQPELADTLRRIANGGAADFYTGETARRLVAAMARNGGTITARDLASYTVRERPPLEGKYRGHKLITAPPPSAGGIGLLQMLGMLESFDFKRAGQGSAASIHYMAEVMRRFYADRSEYLADPDFHRVPVAQLLAPEYVARRRSDIDPARASSSDQLGPGIGAAPESHETTHFSIVDQDRNAVAVTYTLNGGYGSGVTVPGLGFLLNNEMDDFSVKPGEPNMFGLIQGKANAIEKHKRPLSSMTPTIVLRDDKLRIVLGAPGGPRIVNAILQVLVNILDFDLNSQDAVMRPRFHHQWKPDVLFMEDGFSPDTVSLLRSRGHKIAPIATVGLTGVIVVGEETLYGAADPRGDGKVAGY